MNTGVMGEHAGGVEPDRADADGGDLGRTVSVALPAYNEVDNVEPLVEEVLAAFDTEGLSEYELLEIVVVDDGSTDGTDDVIRELADRVPEVRGVLFRRNFGQSEALAAAIEHSRGDIIVTMDADGQNDPADIPRLVDELEEGWDCVSGWRKERNDPLGKRVASRVQTYLAWLTGPKIHDFGCGLKAYRSEALEDISIHGEKHRYVPSEVHRMGYRITELPVNHRARKHGRSKYGLGRLLGGSLDLLFHAFWSQYSKKPIHFLGGLGVLAMGLGTVIGLHLVVLDVVYNVSLLPKLPRLLLAVVLFIFGFQLIIFGFLAEVLSLIYYDQQPSYAVEEIVE